jgi:CelD/BcsL family acetyltransferase involved in cellulose biosynthesis
LTDFEEAALIRIQTLKSAGEFESIRPLWQHLAGRTEATVFQQFHWNRLAAEIFDARERPHVIVATRDHHSVILPLVIRNNRTAALLGESLFDYRDMLSTGDPELEFAALGEASKLRLPLEITALTPEAAQRWNIFSLKPFCSAPRIVRANCSSERLVESHRRLGRHSRRLAARSAQLKHRDGSDREFIRDLYAKKSLQDGSLFTDSLRRDFMERVCQEEGNRCRIFTYETSTDIVAALLTLHSDHARLFYTTYFDTEWQAFSPGQVLLFQASVEVLRDNLDCDFLTGEYPYKMRLANHSIPLMRLEASTEQWRDAVTRRQTHIAA